MVDQGTHHASTFWVLLAFVLPLKLIFPQPAFTGCLVWGKNWRMSWFSHLCLLSPPKWKCIQTKLFWKHILSIQVLLQDLTTEGTSGSHSWQHLNGGGWTMHSQYLLRKKDKAWDENRWKLFRDLERQDPVPNCFPGGQAALLITWREWDDSKPALDKVASEHVL